VADTVSQIGGFMLFVYAFWGLFVNWYNRKFFLLNFLQDSYLVKKTDELASNIANKTSKKLGNEKILKLKANESKDFDAIKEGGQTSAIKTWNQESSSDSCTEDEGARQSLSLEQRDHV
jgi:hypothetical protein